MGVQTLRCGAVGLVELLLSELLLELLTAGVDESLELMPELTRKVDCYLWEFDLGWAGWAGIPPGVRAVGVVIWGVMHVWKLSTWPNGSMRSSTWQK